MTCKEKNVIIVEKEGLPDDEEEKEVDAVVDEADLFANEEEDSFSFSQSPWCPHLEKSWRSKLPLHQSGSHIQMCLQVYLKFKNKVKEKNINLVD